MSRLYRKEQPRDLGCNILELSLGFHLSRDLAEVIISCKPEAIPVELSILASLSGRGVHLGPLTDLKHAPEPQPFVSNALIYRCTTEGNVTDSPKVLSCESLPPFADG